MYRKLTNYEVTAGCINYVYLFLFVLLCYTSHYNKRLLTYYNCLTILINLSIEANTVDPDQTAPIGAV